MRQVAVTGLYKAFGTHPVLTGVDLEVPAGSLTAILGPSGSGKTTLLRLLAGFERADAGAISIGDGLVAAFCLVFLSAVTELTATLLLIPTGTQTLATQFWAYESNLSYSQAAPFALVMIIVAAVPSYVLGRFFNRPVQARG